MISPVPRVIAFDLDGTLVDTMNAFADLAALVMSTHHGQDVAEGRARYLETSGIPFCQQLDVIHPGHAANPRASDEFEARRRAITARTPMDDGSRRGLERLRERGIRLVVSSNTGQDFVDEFAAREPFRFDLALGFDPARGLAKGTPHFEAAMAHFGVARDDLLFVGDSIKDGEIAGAFGVRFIGRLGTFSLPQFEARFPSVVTIDNVDRLPDLF